MLTLDIRTLFLCEASVNVVLALVMLAYWRTQKTYQGFGIWVASSLVMSAGYVLLSLRDITSPVLSFVLSYTLLILTPWLRLEGIKRFLGSSRIAVGTFLVPLLAAIALVVLTFPVNSALGRVIVISASTGGAFVAIAVVLIFSARRGTRFSHLWIAVMYVLYTGLLAYLAVTRVLIPTARPLFAQSPSNSLFFLFSILFEIGATAAFLILNSQRLASDLEQAQESAEGARRRLADTVAFLPDPTFVVDAAGRVVTWNRSMEAMTGVSAASMVGKGDNEYALPFYGERRPMLVDLALHPEREAAAIAEHARRDGLHLTAEVSVEGLPAGPVILWKTAAPLLDGSGVIVGAIECMRDITERHRLQGQFIAAQKMETVGRLAGGIAHQFNNVLTAVMGYAEMARQALPMTDPIREQIDAVLKGSGRLARLTQELLAFARRQIMRPAPLDLNLLVRRMDGAFEALLDEGIERIHRLAPVLGLVLADMSRMEQVLLNLAANARDAMTDKGKLVIETANVTLPATAVLAAVKYVRLAVSDNGRGMSPEIKAHVFEPFFTTKEIGEGTGLALAACYGIVRQHGGDMKVESAPGAGTRFDIFLPRVPGPL